MHDSMCLLNQYHIEKVGTPQKSISGKPFACNILYPKKKKKKPLLRAFIISLLKSMKMTYDSLRNWTLQSSFEYYISIQICIQ